MRVVVVTPPEPVITLDEAKAHLGVFHDDDDLMIDAMVAAATGHIDGPTGWLGRAIGVQQFDAWIDHFGCGSIRLPYPPTISVDEVEYIDGAGTAVPIDAEEYELAGASLMSVYGVAWPTPRYQREAVRVRYTAGYEEVPQVIKAAILLMTGDLYANRETSVTGTIATAVPMSTTVANLLGPLRVFA